MLAIFFGFMNLFPKLCVFLLLISCSRAEDQSINSTGKLSMEETKSSSCKSEEEILSWIRDTENPFELAAMMKDYRRRGGRSVDVIALLKDKYKEVTRKIKPIGLICDEIEVVAYSYRKIGEKDYRLSIIFKAISELDENYRIYIHGYVDKDNLNVLHPHRRKYGFDNWSFEPLPPTSVWDIGEYIVASTEFEAQSFPYLMRIGFHRTEEGVHGDGLELGWVAALDTTEDKLFERITKSNDLIELYELERRYDYSGGISKSVQCAFKERQCQLLEEPLYNCPISPEVNLIAFQYRRGGEDKYRISYIFQVNKKIKEDYLIYLHGYVKEDDLLLLSPERRQYKCDNWSFAPKPRTSTWRKGENILITDEITVRNIPYDIKTGFYLPRGTYPGVECDLGWTVSRGGKN